MKVYVAASSSEMERAKLAIEMLAAVGIECTSRWYATIVAVGEGNPADATHADRLQWAQDNLDDIKRSDVVWMLVPSPGVMSHGAFFELGFTRGLRAPVPEVLLPKVIDMSLVSWEAPAIVASGGDHRWVFVALADRVEPNDAAGLDAVLELFHLWLSANVARQNADDVETLALAQTEP